EAETRVGIHLSRSLEMITSVLAVLKAGAMYVPLNPEDPKRRTEMLAEQAGISILITQSRVQPCLRNTRLRVIALDDDEAEISDRPDTAPPIQIAAKNLAYAICSSGSTGAPNVIL